jgi:transcriptional regulator with XRE-family HTH domain
MRSDGLFPLRVPPGFWAREDVAAVVRRRDVGALFRLLRKYGGASQTQIGVAVGMEQGTVSRLMSGHRVVSAIDVLDRIAEGLTMPDQARMWLGLAPKEDPMKRRAALGVGIMTALSPQTPPTTHTTATRQPDPRAQRLHDQLSSSCLRTPIVDRYPLAIVVPGKSGGFA